MLKGMGNTVIVIFSSYVTASVCSAAALMFLVDMSSKPAYVKKQTGLVDAKLPDIVPQNYFKIRKAVVGRNIFNSNGEVPDESSSSSSGEVVEAPKGEFNLDGPCVDTKLPLKLTGTIYMGADGTSLASVLDTSASATDTYKRGDSIIDHGGAVVAMVERKRIIINNNGIKECLSVDLSENEVRKPTPNSSRNNNSRTGNQDTEDRLTSDIDVASQDGETVVLTSSYVETQLGEGFGKIIQAARLVPKNGSNGDLEGFKIFAIKPDSILSKVGFKNGDIITKVNDTSMKRPDQGFALYQSLQDENDLVIQVLRGGKTPTSLKVQIK
jgi:type II secretion system protein C